MDKVVYTVVYETEHFTDGFECKSFEDALGSALNILLEWMYEGADITWRPMDDTEPNKDQIADWNHFINNNVVRIYKHAYGDEYGNTDLVWCMDNCDVVPIGWKEVTA